MYKNTKSDSLPQEKRDKELAWRYFKDNLTI